MKRSPNRRIWTDIAEDIGCVLRKQIVQRRTSSIDNSDKKRSAQKIIRSLVEEQKVNNPLDFKGRKVFFMGHLKALPRNNDRKVVKQPNVL